MSVEHDIDMTDAMATESRTRHIAEKLAANGPDDLSNDEWVDLVATGNMVLQERGLNYCDEPYENPF